MLLGANFEASRETGDSLLLLLLLAIGY